MKHIKLFGIVAILIAIIALLSYRIDLPSFHSNKMIPQSYDWMLTGESFVTTYTSQVNLITGAKDTHKCLAGNDESCFLITVRSGNYASYFNAFRISQYDTMMSMSGSTVTINDLKDHLKAGFNEVKTFPGNKGTWHLVDIGYEAQHMYIERPWGTLIVTDMLGLKGASYEDRKYIKYTDMPNHIMVD